MSTEGLNEEKQLMVDELARKFGITNEAAEACFVASGWSPEGSEKIAGMNRVERLLIKLRFQGKNPLPHGGCGFILLKQGMSRPESIRGITRDGNAYLDELSPHLPNPDFIKSVQEPPKQYQSNPTWLSLKSILESAFTPDLISRFFELGDLTTGRAEESEPVKAAFLEAIKPRIDSLFMESIRLEAAPVFLNEFLYDPIKNFVSGAAPSGPPPVNGDGNVPPPETWKIKLKGRFIIDTHRGVMIDDLLPGDTVICDIIDHSPMAREVSKMLGAIKHGIHLPVKGRVVAVEDVDSGSKRITLRAAKGVYIIANTLSTIKIRVSETEFDSIKRRIEQSSDESVRIVLGILPLALIILGAALALTILFQRG